MLSSIPFFFLLIPKEEPAPKTIKTTSSSNPSDADHAEDATSGISDDGIILLLCINLSSFVHKIFLTSENRFSFVTDISSNPIIFEDWPHYNNGKTNLPPSSGDYQTEVWNFSNDNFKIKQPTVFQDTTDQDATDSTAGCDFFYLKIRRPQ